MLVLTRKRSESIRIGNNVVIKVMQTSRGSVKLGIEAPADVSIVRFELPAHTVERKFTVDAVADVNLEAGECPLVAEACVESARPALRRTRHHDVFEEALPGRSIRRILHSYHATIAK